jgi:hypothetical protein
MVQLKSIRIHKNLQRKEWVLRAEPLRFQKYRYLIKWMEALVCQVLFQHLLMVTSLPAPDSTSTMLKMDVECGEERQSLIRHRQWHVNATFRSSSRSEASEEMVHVR